MIINNYKSKKKAQEVSVKYRRCFDNLKKNIQETFKIWKQIPQLAAWLELSATDETQYYCLFCGENKAPRLDLLRRHANTPKHKNNEFKFLNVLPPLTDLEKSVEIAAISLSGLFAVKHLAPHLIESLLPLLKKIFPDSLILQNLHLSRFKMTEIIKKILADTRRKRLREVLQNQEFSIIIDESTDKSTLHSLCVVVRYVDNVNQKVNESLWDLIDVYDSDKALASAEQLKAKVMKSFDDQNVPEKNIFGLCSDTCNCMLLVADMMKDDNSNVFYTKCPAHMEQLAAKQAIKILFKDIQQSLTFILNYVSGSGKRSKLWFFQQKRLGMKPLKIVRPGFTRWISWIASVEYVLYRWYALSEYFRNRCAEENCKDTAKILEFFNDPMKRYYLIFLQFVLSKFSSANVILQSVTPIVTESSDKMSELLTDILLLYMKESYVKSVPLQNINPADTTEMVHLSMTNVGDDITDAVHREKFESALTSTEREGFFKKCRKFLIIAAIELKKRLQLKETVIYDRYYFHPKNALDEKFHATHDTLDPFFEAVSFEMKEDL